MPLTGTRTRSGAAAPVGDTRPTIKGTRTTSS